MRGPSDDSGSKNKLQAIGSTVSYLQRYSLMSILGLAAKGVDDDGNSGVGKDSDSNKITDDQVLTIEAFITENELDRVPIMKYLETQGVESFADMPAKSFDTFMSLLKRKVAQK